jgi:hypothetical protein
MKSAMKDFLSYKVRGASSLYKCAGCINFGTYLCRATAPADMMVCDQHTRVIT